MGFGDFDCLVGVSKRFPIPIDDIKKSTAAICLFLNDDLRCLVVLLSDTGMRLAEVAGLLKSDIILDEGIPFIKLQPHVLRKLKNLVQTGRTACGNVSMGCSEAVRGLLGQRLCFP